MPFVKGQSGNPGGRVGVPHEIREMLKAAAPAAVKLLVDICNDENIANNLRVECAKTLLDRAYGKPAQALSVDASVGTTMTVTQMSVDEMMQAIREAATVISDDYGVSS